MAVEIDGTSKGLLGAFALFALGSGITTLVYGVLLLLRYASIEYNYGVFNLFSTSILLVVVGSLIIITVILGVIGALTDVSNLRLVALALLFILFAILTAVGVWGMISFKTGRVQRSIDADMKFLSDMKYSDLPQDARLKADYLQKNYNCCGFTGTDDNRAGDDGKPDSCCIVPGCGSTAGTTLNNEIRYFEKGCAGVYFETKAKAVYHVAILTLVTAGLALIALVFYGVVSQRARGGYAVVSRG